MLEFFKGLDMVQWALLAGGGLLLAPTAYKHFASYFTSDSDEDNKVDEKQVTGGEELTNLVKEWEQLHTSCHNAGLDGACEKLFELFPMLVNSYDHKE